MPKRKLGRVTTKKSRINVEEEDTSYESEMLELMPLLRDGQDDGKVHRIWRMTVYNYTQEDFEGMKRWSNVVRFIVSKQVDDGGASFLQCRVEWKEGKCFAEMKAMMLKAHLDVSKVVEFRNEMKADSEIFYVDNRTKAEQTELGTFICAVKYGDDDDTLRKYYPCQFRKYRRIVKDVREAFQTTPKQATLLNNPTISDGGLVNVSTSTPGT
jgi:hypothetical protein